MPACFLRRSPLLFVLVVVLAVAPEARAQAPAVLSLSPSAQQNGMGGVGVALPLTEAAGFFYNPAQLGHFGRAANLAAQTYPGATSWLDEDQLQLANAAVSGGYDLARSLGVPLSVGAGFSRTTLDLSTVELRERPGEGGLSGTFAPRERALALAAGVGLDYLVDISLGAAVKWGRVEYQSEGGGGTWPTTGLSVVVDDTTVARSARAWDVGVLVTVPVLEAVRRATGASARMEGWAPFAHLSLGYALQNVGGEIETPFYRSPLPRTARLGYALHAGADVAYGGGALRLLEIEAGIEAEDLLITYDPETGAYAYQNAPLGDIGVFKNVLLARGDRALAADGGVTSRRGLRLGAAETLHLSLGHFKGGGFDGSRTWGVTLCTGGLLKVWAARSGSAEAAFARDHLDLRYTRSVYFAGGDFETTFQSFALVIRGF